MRAYMYWFLGAYAAVCIGVLLNSFNQFIHFNAQKWGNKQNLIQVRKKMLIQAQVHVILIETKNPE